MLTRAAQNEYACLHHNVCVKGWTLALLWCSAAIAASPEWSGWFAARSPHFEVYSQAGPERAKSTLLRFEELRAFFDKNRLVDTAGGRKSRPPLRVVEFRTEKQYDAVRLRPTADAYYSSAADSDYIVMPIFALNDFGIAAHEYSHFVLHSGGLKLPPWLNEGLAELFSTVAIRNRQCEIGGAIPGHVTLLRRSSWLPASDLFATEATWRKTRNQAAIFYAESWALTDMLTSKPEYWRRFGEMAALLSSGVASPFAFTRVYGKSAEAMLAEAREWIRDGGSPRRKLSPLAESPFQGETGPVPEMQLKAVIADLLLTNGEWDRAKQIYEELLAQSPREPNLLASLGSVAFHKGETHQAVEYWREAVDAGLQDSALCYRYALLADQMDFSSELTEKFLERAVALRPDFEDARFRLAQLSNNRGDYAAAVAQLRAMRARPPGQAFGYWTALAYALTETGNRDEAEAAAEQAKRIATNSEEFAWAAKLAYIAQTDVSVQFTRDAGGKLQLATTRVPHGSVGSNPFIEAEDHIRIASGNLREVQCHDGRLTAFLIASTEGTLTLSVPDPTHIFIKSGPSEFVCGPQTSAKVRAEYATTAKAGWGLLRGLEF